MERLGIGSRDLINTAKEPTQFDVTPLDDPCSLLTVLHFVGDCNAAFGPSTQGRLDGYASGGQSKISR
jgi:hypothetical protein